MKAILSVGYKHYVVEAADAVRVAEILLGAELYATKYRTDAEGGTTRHIWSTKTDGDDPIITVQLLSDTKYGMYKLAGPPPERE